MESSLTKLEMDAVLQLIQLSGGYDDDFRVVWLNFPVEKDEQKKDGEEEGSSGDAGEALSSNTGKCSDDEPLPRIKPKIGSLLHIYTKTHPVIKNHAKKRRRF